MAKKENKVNKTNKADKGKIFRRIMATFLAALMVLSVTSTLIYVLVRG